MEAQASSAQTANAQPTSASTAAEAVAPSPSASLATAAGAFLAEDGPIEGNGESPLLDLGSLAGKALGVVLGIQASVEQQSLEVTVWGSADGETWASAPLLHFPQKFYAGVSELLLDMSGHPDVRYLKAKWTANRWGRGSTKADFRAYLFVRPA